MYYPCAKLMCVFVFAYADCWFSCAAAQIQNKDAGHLTSVLKMHNTLLIKDSIITPKFQASALLP